MCEKHPKPFIENINRGNEHITYDVCRAIVHDKSEPINELARALAVQIMNGIFREI